MYMANKSSLDSSVMRKVVRVLEDLDVVVSRPVTGDASYDLVIESYDLRAESDTFDRAYVFSCYEDIYDMDLFKLDQSSIMLFIDPDEESPVQACSIAGYRKIGPIAFNPVEEFFNFPSDS